jgi:hypothetical protein
VDDAAARAPAGRWIPGLALLLYAGFELRAFLAAGLPVFFDAHSHLTRSWLAARALEAGSYPTWSFDWYGGYRLFDFYSPGWYLLTAGLGMLGGGVISATKLLLYAGQCLAVLAFFAFLLRLGAAPLAALFGALLFLLDAERWTLLRVIGNYPTVILYALAPLLLLAAQRADGTRRGCLRLFASSALLISGMALGHLTNAVQILPALLAFAAASLWQRLPRPGPALAALAAAVPAAGVATAFLTVPMLRNLHLVSLSLDTGGVAWDLEPVGIALGLAPGSMRRIFVASPGVFWCLLALAAGLLSLHPRQARWRPCFAGLCASLLSMALLGERAAISLIFFVSPLCVAALEIAGAALRTWTRPGAALALQGLAVAALPLWHLTRDLTPLRYVDPQSQAVYQRIPKPGELGRSFDVTPATDAVDGVYGQSSFSPYWTGRGVPFGAFPQGAPLASNLQLALIGMLVSELAAPEPALSREALDLLALLNVEWLVDRSEPPRLARIALDPGAGERLEPGLLRLRGASPALFAPRVEALPRAALGAAGDSEPALLARLQANWAKDPLAKRGQPSLDALNRTGTRRDWPLLLPLLRGMHIQREQRSADRFLVEQKLDGAPGAPAQSAPPAAPFAVLSHREQLRSAEIVARAPAPGFVRLSYSFDPELALAIDGEPAPAVADFLGGVVLAFPAGTHTISLEAPREPARPWLLALGGAAAAALAILWVWSRLPRASLPATSPP